MKALVVRSSTFNSPPTFPFITLGNLTLSGNALIVNSAANNSIHAGGSITLSGNAGTSTPSGGSSRNRQGGDIAQNDSTLASLTTTQLFQTFFNGTPNAFIATASYNLTSSNSSNAVGLSNTTIYINGNTSYANNSVIGSPSAPVFLYVDGNLSLSGNTKIYGMIFINGSLNTSGNAQIYGAVSNNNNSVVNSDLVIGTDGSSGNTVINYNANILNMVQQLPALAAITPIPGSWKDF
jgi:hypothetical protein